MLAKKDILSFITDSNWKIDFTTDQAS